MQYKDKRIVITNDINDEFGRVYLKKGRNIVLNRQNIGILKKLGILEKVLKDSSDNECNISNDKLSTAVSLSESYKKIKDEFTNSYTVLDKKAFEISSKTIQEIMNNSKTKPWKLHLDTLASYAEWYYSHSVNTALIASMIGVNMGYEKERLRNLIIGSLMHDIGMILIPQELLEKDGDLSDEEFNIQKKHCELGVAMVSSLNMPDAVRSIIMQHHERVDGCGYPLGLKGENITEEAQIVMIADSFDARTSHGSNKGARCEQEASFEILSKQYKYSKEIIEVVKNALWV